MTLTCVACGCVFKTSEVQRTHYKSDWHRYNLKRKVAGLSPLAQDVFDARRAAAMAASAPRSQNVDLHCTLCRKHFSSQGQYNTHIKSKKHKDRVKKAGNGNKAGKKANSNSSNKKQQQNLAEEKKKTISEKSESSEPITAPAGEMKEGTDAAADAEGPEEAVEETKQAPDLAPCASRCFFCNSMFDTEERNIRHMTKKHNFFLPEREFLINQTGFLSYLSEKVNVGHMCLVCQRTFPTAHAAQAHMIDTVHTRVAFEHGVDMDEFEDFFDFSASYAHKGAGAGAGADGEGDEEDQEFAEVLPSGDLLLPDGRVLGHRMYRRYYNQNVVLDDERESTAAAMKAIEDRGAAYGGARGMSTAIVVSKRAALSEKKHLHRHQAKRRDGDLRDSVKWNKIGQPHFRPQVIF